MSKYFEFNKAIVNIRHYLSYSQIFPFLVLHWSRSYHARLVKLSEMRSAEFFCESRSRFAFIFPKNLIWRKGSQAKQRGKIMLADKDAISTQNVAKQGIKVPPQYCAKYNISCIFVYLFRFFLSTLMHNKMLIGSLDPRFCPGKHQRLQMNVKCLMSAIFDFISLFNHIHRLPEQTIMYNYKLTDLSINEVSRCQSSVVGFRRLLLKTILVIIKVPLNVLASRNKHNLLLSSTSNHNIN